MVLHATQNQGNVHAQQDGWVQFVMKNVPKENMDKTAKMYADVEMAVLVTMSPEPAHVRKDGRALYVTAHVPQESMGRTVLIHACVRTMETAIL